MCQLLDLVLLLVALAVTRATCTPYSKPETCVELPQKIATWLTDLTGITPVSAATTRVIDAHSQLSHSFSRQNTHGVAHSTLAVSASPIAALQSRYRVVSESLVGSEQDSFARLLLSGPDRRGHDEGGAPRKVTERKQQKWHAQIACRSSHCMSSHHNSLHRRAVKSSRQWRTIVARISMYIK